MRDASQCRYASKLDASRKHLLQTNQFSNELTDLGSDLISTLPGLNMHYFTHFVCEFQPVIRNAIL